MVSKGHKITNVPLFKKLCDIMVFLWLLFLSHFSGLFEGASTFLTPQKVPWNSSKIIVPQKNHYVPHFLKQRDINSYYVLLLYIIYVMESGRFSQSPAFLKRAGHNVEETTFYTATAILHCTFYPALLNT